MSGKGLSDVSTAAGGRAGGRSRGERRVPALTVVSHPALHRAGERVLLPGLVEGREVGLSRNAPEFHRAGSALGVPLLDPFLSRKPIALAAGAGGSIVVRAEKAGSVVVGGVPVQGRVEIGAGSVASGVALELSGRVVLLLHLALDGDGGGESFGMVGDSVGLRQVRSAIEQVVDLAIPVLVRGETGTGKELVAQAIHERGARRGGPFVAVNLGAIPRELAAAELFGAQRGAYTGAHREREGFFRAADGGTLFLDEIGEASPEVQVLLLRALETGEIYPVGGSSPVAVDVRLVAATDADLDERIRQGGFKAPLLHRLAGYDIRLPPLRERREDIGALFFHFARKELLALGDGERLSPEDPYAEPWLPAAVAARLLACPWPGNVRQLRNVTRQLVIGSRGKAQIQEDLPILRELAAPASPPVDVAAPAAAAAPRRRKSTEVSEGELLSALRESGWDVKAAADRLGVPRSSIYDLIDRFPSVRTAGDLGAEEITACFRECGGDLARMAERLRVSRPALNRRLRELGLT